MTPPSTAARLARQAARLDAALTTAITRLTTAMPALGNDDAQGVLQAAVPIPVRGAARFLEELAAHLAAHPDALTSGDSLCPPVLLRVTHVLHDAGHPVIRPACASCGTVRTVLRRPTPQGRICATCDARSRLATCARCGRPETRIAARRAEGGICHPCYRTDPQVVEECSECGRLCSPAVRLPDGGSLCRGCWKRPNRECVSCGQMKPAALIDEDGALCHLCYNRHRRPRRPCGRCGRLGRIARNAAGDHPDLCDSCYRGPETSCSRCGRVRPCQRISSAAPICHTCYARDERPRVTCCRCQRDLPVMTYWPIGPVCQSCYTAILRSPAECARCRCTQPLIARDDDGAGVCGPCAGHHVDYTCHRCGRAGNPYGNGRCAYCVLADKVRDLLTGPDGTVSAQLQPLVEAFHPGPPAVHRDPMDPSKPEREAVGPSRRRRPAAEPSALGRAATHSRPALHQADHGADRRAARTARGHRTGPVLAGALPDRQASRAREPHPSVPALIPAAASSQPRVGTSLPGLDRPGSSPPRPGRAGAAGLA